ncbi:1-phosphatidylinositol-3-phosphate 5-kinase FAB1B [Hibiscus syriacus]|uniref:1-phosphatidylinositol-3-phosphate 5-kinase FAB1B n=1 Tax=Hibiscus syriacus TaxID=106335 RepID=A0A6A3BE32_HIBSY|nr:1-phosphatidylinositol-3-phosphate 5-kinase FAB1B [Hibiscus syriacus]
MATKFDIEKFNGINFSLWKLKMKAILRKDGCLAAISERPVDFADDIKWNEMDGNAMANFHLALADEVLSSIEEKKTAKEIWDHLTKLYKTTSLHNKIFLNRKLYTLREQERAELLLQSLPDSYDQLIINLTNSNVTSLVFDDVAATVLQEENRRKNKEDRQVNLQQAEALTTMTTMTTMRGRSTERGQSSIHKHDIWLIDSGATYHMTSRREWFHHYEPVSGGSVYSCNDHALEIVGVGTIKLKMYDGTIKVVRDVRHVKGLKKNLLSYGLLDNNASKIETRKGIMKVFRGALVVLKGEKIAANLYMLKGETLVEAEASVASCSSDSAMLWHQKLGHIKQHRLKFNTSNSRGKSVLELVHSDVWQAPVTSLGGAKYFVSFIDDYSRRCWVHPIKKKSDVFSTFKNFKARVELDSGNKIKCFKTDNGGKYTSEEFDDFCKKECIKRQFTVANTPQQNGVAERMNRTLLERTRAMLRDAGLEKSFWAEAVNTAYYLVNRAPSTTIELKTPMEMWTGKPVDYSNLHVFGSIVYVMYNAQEISKLDPKSRKCKFSGSCEKTSNWHSDYVIEGNIAYCLLTEDGEPSIYQEAINSSDASLWMMAMQEEIEALHKNNTWDLVPLPQGRKPIGNKWVFKIKRNGDDQVERYRARLVVKGYAQKEGIDFNEIFSPVVRVTTVRVVLAMCAILNLHLEQLDVKTIFLHGNLEEEIYMLQPEGFEEKEKKNLVCRLNKSLYGLKQAPRCWYKRFDSFIMCLGYNRLNADPCAYFKRFGDNDFVILLLYVDDMLVAGPNKDHIEELKAQLAREFEMKDLGSANKILGMQIHRDRSNRKIWLSQKNYLKKILSRFSMQDCKPISTPLPINFKLSSSMSPSSEEERMEMSRVPYASAVGSLMFAMICTRPDIAQAVGVVSRYMANPGKEHWNTILTLQAIWIKANLLQDKSKSTTGYVFKVAGGAVEEGTVDMQKIHTKDNIADFMTKAISTDKFTWCRSSCGLSEIFGRMVACFWYATIDVHSVYLPPPKIEFYYENQEWVQLETDKVANQAELLFSKVLKFLNEIAEKHIDLGSPDNNTKTKSFRHQFAELEGMLQKEKLEFEPKLENYSRQNFFSNSVSGHEEKSVVDIDKLKDMDTSEHGKGSESGDSTVVDAKLNANQLDAIHQEAEANKSSSCENKDYNNLSASQSMFDQYDNEKPKANVRRVLSEGQFPVIENLSDTLDAAWTGEIQRGPVLSKKNSFSLPDIAAVDLEDRSEENIVPKVYGSPSPALFSIGSENMEEFVSWLKMPFLSFYRLSNKNFLGSSSKLDALNVYDQLNISSFRELELQGGARLLLPVGVNDSIIPVYDDELTSTISYALVSPEYHFQLSDDVDRPKDWGDSMSSSSFSDSMTLLEAAAPLIMDPASSMKSLHVRVSFGDDGSDKVKYKVTCYYAKWFETLRRVCCPSELDFIRSLSRCKKWGAQGGKSNVFFAKTLDERFIIKQVTKTELESFTKFAPKYFKYLSEAIRSRSPTCLAKIFGVYQVTTKQPKGGKESRIDVLVMENLLFRRSVTRLYDLKGSSRSRYNPDSSGSNKVLLDQNLIESMPTNPIFVGNKGKRLLERAVWNDTAFLASNDLMDYSLLLGEDEEKHELVIGIIDFLRQYTWDKHLETWVKASGILGGPKNASPTVISPEQYKKRFRKAMSTYFLMMPDQWSPPTVSSKSKSDTGQENAQRATSTK